MGSPCDACIAPCCREAHVLPTGREALRIASALGLPLAAFTELRARERCEGEFRIVLAGPEAGSRRYHRLELRRVPTPDAEHMYRCVFLETSGPAVRCGIYPLRPGPCITFPFQREGELVRLSRISRAYCPPGAWRPEDAHGLSPQVLRREADRAIYETVIDVWNTRVSDAPPEGARYIEFLQAVYSLLEGSAPQLWSDAVHTERRDIERTRAVVIEALRDLPRL